jgi:hypothetical protein
MSCAWPSRPGSTSAGEGVWAGGGCVGLGAVFRTSAGGGWGRGFVHKGVQGAVGKARLDALVFNVSRWVGGLGVGDGVVWLERLLHLLHLPCLWMEVRWGGGEEGHRARQGGVSQAKVRTRSCCVTCDGCCAKASSPILLAPVLVVAAAPPPPLPYTHCFLTSSGAPPPLHLHPHLHLPSGPSSTATASCPLSWSWR